MNDDNMLLGTVTSNKLTLSVKILELDKEVPSKQLKDFHNWLKYKAIECGRGKQKEYYSYTKNDKDDIGVLFDVDFGFECVCN